MHSPTVRPCPERLGFDPTCQSCNLAHVDEKLQKPVAVGGAGPADLTRIRLIVISDYPSTLEVKRGYPLVDNDEERKRRKLIGWRNAGGLLRAALHTLYGLNTYDDCWFTNAIKCDPRNLKPDNSHVACCAKTWLLSELLTLDEAVPTAPILLAGKQAFRALHVLFPDLVLPQSLGEALRSRRYFWRHHFLAFVHNPVQVSRSVYHREVTTRSTPRQILVTKSEELPQILPGSPLWHFLNDLRVLDNYLVPLC